MKKTNDELKKKIVDILESVKLRHYIDEDNKIMVTSVIPQYLIQTTADALIAAGIGEIKEVKFEADHYWSMWQGALVELERAEHRAEVAELVVKNLNDTFTFNYQYVFEQAEKELQEEREDEQN